METLGNQIMPKLCHNFYCKKCDYGTSKKSSYVNHTLSAKHLKTSEMDILETNGNQIMPKLCSDIYSCQNCEKEFKNRSGLWKHNQKCKIDKNINNNVVEDKKLSENELIMMLINENKDFKNLLIESYKENSEYKNIMMKVIENGTTINSHNTTHTNSHNKSFNLQFFLNETCKDAMNITDFVDSIKLQLSDLEKVGELGYVNGISNIIVKNLKELDVTQRPVHCTDKK